MARLTKFNVERPLGTLVAYLITNTVNGKKYVGITHNPTIRKYRHLRCKHNTCRTLRAAVEKYGEDAFTFEIVGCSRTWEDLLVFEEELIAQYDTFAPAGKGYNLTLGGQGALGWLA